MLNAIVTEIPPQARARDGGLLRLRRGHRPPARDDRPPDRRALRLRAAPRDRRLSRRMAAIELLLDPARRGRPLGPVQRQGLRGHRRRPPASAPPRPLPRRARGRAGRGALHDRTRAVTRRRRGEPGRGRHGRGWEPPARRAAAVPLRAPLLAGRIDPGPRLRPSAAPRRLSGDPASRTAGSSTWSRACPAPVWGRDDARLVGDGEAGEDELGPEHAGHPRRWPPTSRSRPQPLVRARAAAKVRRVDEVEAQCSGNASTSAAMRSRSIRLSLESDRLTRAVERAS